ncbi:hypothetical protein [Roseateles sp. P5_E8]
MKNTAFALLAAISGVAHAAIPSDYEPTVVEAPFSFSERVFDLSPALLRAEREHKGLYIYLGAKDCPPCRAYEVFLSQHRAELLPAFRNLVFVDLRTWVRGPDIKFKVGDKLYAFQEFRQKVRDSNKGWSYPYFWLVDPALKRLKKMPVGSDNYLTVDKQLEVLRLPAEPLDRRAVEAPPEAASPEQSPPARSP